MNNATMNPAGWPAHLFPYRPGDHQTHVVGCVTFYPYDFRAGRVHSYVAVAGTRYLGLAVRRSPCLYNAVPVDGRFTMPNLSLVNVARFLTRDELVPQ